MRSWVAKVIKTDEGLISFLRHFGSITHSHTLGDLAAKQKYRLDPKWLEPFLDPDEIVKRLRDVSASQLDAEQAQAVSEFLREYDLRQKGQNPEAEDWED